MTLTINLPPATLEFLQAEAQATGKDVQTVVRDAVAALFDEMLNAVRRSDAQGD